MADEVKAKEVSEKGPAYGTGALKGGEYEVEDVFEGAEEWSPVETKLVIWSFVAAGIALAIGGTLVNMYILH
jgi:hypothetical protein